MIHNVHILGQKLRTADESERRDLLREANINHLQENASDPSRDEITSMVISEFQEKTMQNIRLVENCLSIHVDTNRIFLRVLSDIVRTEMPFHEVDADKIITDMTTMTDELQGKGVSRANINKTINQKYKEIFVDTLKLLNANKEFQPGSKEYDLLRSSQTDFARRSSRIIAKKFEIYEN